MAAQQITQIKAAKADPNLRHIEVGAKRIATLRASDVERLRLHVGTLWTATLAGAVESEHRANQARKRAMNLLGRRMYSRGELIDRLARAKFDRSIAVRIADELVTDRWIDDRQYAREILRSLTRTRPASKLLLLDKLISRKVDPETAREILDEWSAGMAPAAQALQLAAKSLDKMKHVNSKAQGRRLAGLLARRGFDEEIVFQTLQQLDLIDDAQEKRGFERDDDAAS
jgi:regulatory protein